MFGGQVLNSKLTEHGVRVSDRVHLLNIRPLGEDGGEDDRNDGFQSLHIEAEALLVSWHYTTSL